MALPSMNNFTKYINTKLTGLNWNTNLQTIINIFSNGLYDYFIAKLTANKGAIFNNEAGDNDFEIKKETTGTAYKYDAGADTHTFGGVATFNDEIEGDLTGDVYASNGTSKILENGTDGTDAEATLNLLKANVIQKLAAGELDFKNSAGNSVLKIGEGTGENRRIKPYFIGQKVGDFAVNTTTDLVYSGAYEIGLLLLCRNWGGGSQHDYKLYFYAQSALTFTITLIGTSQSADRATLAYLSSSGAPNYEGTLRVTDTEATDGERSIYKMPILGLVNYGY